MNKKITLSKASQKWINLIAKQGNTSFLERWKGSPTSIESNDLIAWLKADIISTSKEHYWLEFLRTSLLHDLNDSFSPGTEKQPTTQMKPKSWFAKIQVGLFAIAGTVLAICQGFDAASPILGLFVAAPAAVVLILGLAFSTLSLAVFYGFDLVVISNNLGVKLNKSPKLIHVFLEQVEQIKLLRKKIDHCYLETSNTDQLRELQALLRMLAARYKSLDQAREVYTNALNSTSLKVAKSITAIATGVLFFLAGYFSGQALALLVASMFTAAVAVTFWPIVVPSILVGLAAFCIYWYVERPGLQNLIGRWFGMDKDDIDAFADVDIVSRQKQKFSFLEARVSHRIEEQQTLNASGNGLTFFANAEGADAAPTSRQSEMTAERNPIPRSKSMGDLTALYQDRGSSRVTPIA